MFSTSIQCSTTAIIFDQVSFSLGKASAISVQRNELTSRHRNLLVVFIPFLIKIIIINNYLHSYANRIKKQQQKSN